MLHRRRIAIAMDSVTWRQGLDGTSPAATASLGPSTAARCNPLNHGDAQPEGTT